MERFSESHSNFLIHAYGKRLWFVVTKDCLWTSEKLKSSVSQAIRNYQLGRRSNSPNTIVESVGNRIYLELNIVKWKNNDENRSTVFFSRNNTKSSGQTVCCHLVPWTVWKHHYRLKGIPLTPSKGESTRTPAFRHYRWIWSGCITQDCFRSMRCWINTKSVVWRLSL